MHFKKFTSPKHRTIIYTSPNHKKEIPVRIDYKTAWLTLEDMADLFKKRPITLTKRINTLYDINLYKKSQTHRQSILTSPGGEKQTIHYYTIDIVNAIGRELNSPYLAPFEAWYKEQSTPKIGDIPEEDPIALKKPISEHLKENAKLLGVSVGIPFLLILFLIYQLFIPASLDNHQIQITIPHKSSTKTILTELEKQNLIHSIFFMRVYVKLFSQKPLHFGKYKFSASSSPLAIVKHIQNHHGEQDLIRITIPEGFSILQIADTLEKAEVTKAALFMEYLRSNAKQELAQAYPFLNEFPFDTIEGYLFPDTYFFAYNSPPKLIVATMLREFQRNMLPIWENRSKSKSKLSLHQTLTLASILEKEAVHQSELPTIASVYHNRIQKRMRLEADPTVVYALGKAHKNRVYYKDLRVDSPYNTYKFFGLPPTPISSPGKPAFAAAASPADTPFFYFVANPKTRYHIFGRNFQEHERNIRQVR